MKIPKLKKKSQREVGICPHLILLKIRKKFNSIIYNK